MGVGRSLAHGAAWTYGSQLVIVVLQFGYAGVTTRTLDDGAFGAYAVALSVTGFVALLSTGGIGQSVGRMAELHPPRLRGLTSYAVALGLLAAAAVWVSAPFWVMLWQAPEALEPIRWLAVSAALAPLLGLATGYIRRVGKFRQLAIFTLVANILGMGLGAAAVLWWRTVESLLVFPVLAQAATLVGAIILAERKHIGFASLRHARDEVAFSWKITVASLLSYGIGNIVKIGSSRVLGPAIVGQWNRADVLSAVPFQQMQGALIPVVYPEFRHDIEGGQRARIVWTDMLSLVAWIVLPSAAVAAVVIPNLLPILFGEGWEIAVALSPFICVATAIGVVSTLLASAVEALGKFRWIWWTQGLLLVIQVVAVVAISATNAIFPAMVALIITHVAQHSVYVILCAREGYLDAKELLRRYCIVVVAGVIAFAFTWLIFAVGAWLWGRAPYLSVLTAIPVSAVLLTLWFVRHRLPPLQIAKRYGIL